VHEEVTMVRPLVKLNSTGPDVMDAILRLNLSGADPQVLPSETFEAQAKAATEVFQANHGLVVDGQIGQNTWDLLDQLDGGRLVPAANIAAVQAARDAARAALGAGQFAAAKALLNPVYAQNDLPPETRAPIVANLGWAEHGLGDVDRARALYLEHLAILQLFGGIPLAARDTISRLRDLNLGQGPGVLPSDTNKANLPPNG
jgi:peptidoglycan hydrolase-like protein with peptidoglycan-binding domain